MAKLKIYGNANPVVGKKEFYSVDEFFAPSPSLQLPETDFKSTSQEEVKWSIWVKYGNEWTKMISNNKTGTTVCYTFSQVSITRKGIRMLVEKNGEKALLEIQTHKTTNPSIVKVDLLDGNYNIPTKPFAYGETIIARVHCVDMEMLQAKVTLWEDNGDKNNAISSNLIIESKQGNILNGICEISFYLNPMNAWRVNANNANEGEMHEYYVTAEIFTKKYNTATTKNTNVANPQYIPSPAEQKGPSNKDQQQIAMSERRVHDYNEQRVRISPTIAFPVREVTNSLMMVDMNPQSWWPFNDKKEDGSCPNCDKPITVLELKQIFTNTDNTVLEKVAQIYNKYMKELEMNTCWTKAHFFAQAVVESGKELKVSGGGESFNYSADDLHLGRWNEQKTARKIIFSYFASHKEEAYRYGRIKELRNGRMVTTQYANEEMIAKLAYGPNSSKGRELGNTQPNDGWDLRGRGLVQLTGRAGYEYANAYTKREGADIVANPDLVVENVAIAVLSSMAFFKWKGITKKANEETVTEFISRMVGLDVPLANGKRNHTEKQEVFTKNTAIVFETNKCKYGEDQKTTDLKIQQGVTWLESIAIEQDLANEKLNYKVLYANDQDRTSKKGEDTMDCSELVCRYLQKIEWSSKVLSLNTSGLFDYAKKHSIWLQKHDSTDYEPKVGDVFIWKNDSGSMGHTGVVINFNKNTDIVTTIEAIHSSERPEDANTKIDLQGVVKLKWKRLSKHLINHPTSTPRYTASSCRFYTPKIHYSKQDKK